jgi:hypothetical protein
MVKDMTHSTWLWLPPILVGGLLFTSACGVSTAGLPGDTGGTTADSAGSGGKTGASKSSGGSSGSAASGGNKGSASAGAKPVSSGGSGGSTPGSAGQSGSSGVGGTIAVSTGSGVCSEAPCLASLFLPCQPSGACTMQSLVTTDGWTRNNDCYSSGIKVQTASSGSGSVTVATYIVKRNDTVCYRIDGRLPTDSATASYSFFDGSGVQVASGNINTNSSVLTVTCNGGKAVVLSDACQKATGDTSSCASGVCAF